MAGGGNAAPDLGALLGALPGSFRAAEEDGTWFVVGPTGAFVVAAAPADPAGAAARARALAAGLRARLDRTLGWSPFVEALVVTEEDHPLEGATRVPTRLLHDTIVCGPLLLDEPWVAALARCLEARAATV